jgi:hypothetical protein
VHAAKAQGEVSMAAIFRFIVEGVQLTQLVHKIGLSELLRSVEQILQGQMPLVKVS